MSKTELRAMWEKRIADFLASGQTGSAWCESNEIDIYQFRYWSRKFRLERQSEPTSVKWVSLQVGDSTVEDGDSITIRVGHASLQVKSGFNPALLRQVVQALANA